MFKKMKKYFSEVAQEISKVSWPERQSLYGSVGVVIVLCLILSVFVFGVDFVLSRLLNLIF